PDCHQEDVERPQHVAQQHRAEADGLAVGLDDPEAECLLARGPAIPDLLEEGMVPKDHQDQEAGVERGREVPAQAQGADGPGESGEDQDGGQDPPKDQSVDEAGPHPRAELSDVDPHPHRLRGDDRVPLDTHARLTGRLTSRLMAPLILVAGGVAATWISTRSSSIIGPNGTAWSRPAPGEA